MAEEPGTLYLEAGPSQQSRFELGNIQTAQAAQAAGSTGTYIDGKGRQGPLSGVPFNLERRPFKAPNGEVLQVHRLPGESLYLSLDAIAVDQLDTSAFSIEIHETVLNTRTGAKRSEIWTAAKQIVDPAIGGVVADPFTTPGQIVPASAFPRLGPDEVGVLKDLFKVVTADQ